jgi:LmbE family N-acetylglucosaminyl deacetylase
VPPPDSPPTEQRRALAIYAHPDDIDFGAAGTIARWVAEGWDVRYVCVTSGQKGGQDASVTPDEYGAMREQEQRAAAATVGVTDVTFLRWMDSEVFESLALRKALSREFRRARPHRILTMNPELLPSPYFVNHPDHRAVGTCALDITMTGGTTAQIFPELLDEGLPPWRELEETWLMGPSGGDRIVDVTDTIDKKIAALECHHSQTAAMNVREFMTKRLADIGHAHGYSYAEAFRVQSYRR